MTVQEGVPSYNGPPNITYHASGASVAIHGGYNWLFGPDWLVGFEGAFGGTDASGHGQYSPYVGIRSPYDSRAQLNESLFLNGTAHVGFLVTPDALLYAKGGVSGSERDFQFIDSDPTGLTIVNGGDKNGWVTGWTAGGGVEFANLVLPAPWTTRLEYNYYGYNNVNMTALASNGVHYPFTHKGNESSIMFGVSYHF